MAVLVQGQVRDRPWGQTLGALGLRKLSGQLTLHAEDKDYAIAFDLGAVVGAWSPLASDSAPRVALTNHLLSSTQVAAIARRIAAMPDRDEVDIVAELGRLSGDQIAVLRSKLVAQRAARTFAIESGEFEIEDQITIPVIPGAGIDIRTVVYLGARMNLSEQRLTNALRLFGTYFQLKPDALGTLDSYGFTDAERTVLVELRAGTSLHELEAAHRDVDPRMVQAMVYALFGCGACEISEAPAVPRAATVRRPKPPEAESAPTIAPAAVLDAVEPLTLELEEDAREPSGAVPLTGLPSDMDAPPVAAPYPSRVPTPNAFPLRTPTPPLVSEPYQQRAPITGRTQTENPFPQRSPTPPRAGGDERGVPRSPTAPITGRTQTDNPFPQRSPTPPIAGRTQTENPFPLRSPTPPVTSRTGTDNPFPQRSPTPPVQSRTASGPRVNNGPDEPGVPRSRAASTHDGIDPPSTRMPRPGGAPAAPRAGTANPAPRAGTANPAPVVARTGTGTVQPAVSRTATAQPAVARTGTGRPAVARTGTGPPAVARTGTGQPAIARTTTARKTAALIAARTILLEQGADHFALLGVPFDAPMETVRVAYLNLVRQLHPDKLAELSVDDASGNAQQLFAAMGNAFSVLTDAERRAAYVASLTGGPGAPRTKTGDEVGGTPATEAFRRGESALRRDEPHEAIAHFQRAVELAPQDLDYAAMLGWAQFCASHEKEKTAPETRKALERAVHRSPKPYIARFLLGRVERMLGRDKEALRHFNIVLEDEPSHAEARSEVRAIEARLAATAGKKR